MHSNIFGAHSRLVDILKHHLATTFAIHKIIVELTLEISFQCHSGTAQRQTGKKPNSLLYDIRFFCRDWV